MYKRQVLHSIFDKMEQASQQKEADIDYCPVAIMYCKLVEAMLKKLHLRLYIAALPDHTITRGSPITFGQLTKKKTLSKNKGKLSIGSFSYPIVTIDRKDPANSKVIEEGIQALCGGSAKARREWRAHAAALATIQLCRNKSAHELTRVTRQEFVQLIRTLFSEGELLRIQELKQSEEAV